MISMKRSKTVRYLATMLMVALYALPMQAQEGSTDNARNKRMTTASGGWFSGGINTSFISVGQNGASTLLTATDGQTQYKGNFGFVVPLVEKIEPNQAPIAISASRSVFYKLGDVLRLNGFDPDGDAIRFEVTQGPENGELTVSGARAGRFTFTPAGSLLPKNGYKDTIRFKAIEVEGEKLESEVAMLPFTFNVADEAHEITNLTVASSSESAKTLALTLTDSRFNANYTIDIGYIDLSNPSAPKQVSIVNSGFSLESFTQDSNTLTQTISVSKTDHPYLFSAEKAIITVLVKTRSGFSDDDLFVLTNTSNGSGGTISHLDSDTRFFTQNGDTKSLTNQTSSDGLFFSFASEKETPENTAVSMNLFAVELGDFDLNNASIAITTNPKKGSITDPVLVKSSANLAQWTVFYSPVGDVGYLDSLEFTVTSADREASVSAFAKVQVVDVNDPPTLSAIADQQLNEEEAGTVDLNFADVDNDLIVTVTSSNANQVAATVSNGQLTLTPALNFNGKVNITVLVEEEGTSEAYSKLETFEVEVVAVNDAPIMASISDQVIDEDNVFTYTLSATDVDAAVPLFTYKATPDIAGVATVSINGNVLTVTPSANYFGTINFSVTADDRLGTNTSVSAAETFSLTINPVNDAPVSVATIPAQNLVDVQPAYIMNLGLYFDDVETSDANLTFTHNATGTLFTLSVEQNNLTVTPIQGQSGSEDVTITVSDGELSVSQTVTFNIQGNSSDITAATIDNVSIDEDAGAYTVDLSGVFADTGDPSAQFSYTIGGLSKVSSSLNGTDLVLTPEANFNGTETILVIASANGKTSFTSFQINVNAVNDAPTLGSVSAQSIQEDGLLSDLYITFEDIDTDASDLSFTATSSNESLIASTAIGISKGSNGITLSAPTLANASGSTTITVTVSDGELTATRQFTVNVLSVNDAPTVISTTIAAALEDAAYEQALSGLFADVDGDNLSYSIEGGPEWLSIDNGSLSGTPGNDDVGNTSFYITASDGSGGSVRQQFSITVTNTNDAPVVVSPAADITATEDVLLSSFISSSIFNDVDGDNLTLSATFSGANWLTFDATNNRFTGTPGNDDVGTVNITITATDPDGASASDELVLTVVNTNDTPTDLALSAITVAENSDIGTVIGSLSTTDVDAGDSFTYTLVSGSGAEHNDVFAIANGNLVTNAAIDFESSASLNLRLQTTDAAGATYQKSFTIVVTNVNEAPTALSLSNLSLAENSGNNAEVGSLSTTDPDNGDSFTYSLVSGAGDTDNSGFDISNGKLVSKNSLDFETKSSYSVRVKTTDGGGLSTTSSFTITVTDVNETPTDIGISASSIDENVDEGTVVGVLSTTDEDANDSFTYSLASGSNDNDAFSIDGSNLITAAAVDFETKASYTVIVTTTDGGGNTLDKTLTITVNNVAEPSIAAIDGLVFATTDIEETSTLTFTVENTGDTEIEVSSIALPEGFSADKTAFNVAIGSSADVIVTFAPDEAKTYSGEIVMQSTVGETRINVVGEGTIVTGLDDDMLKATQIGLYPNPARDVVTIDLTQLPHIQPDLAIVDLNGNSVWSKQKVQESKVELDTGTYPAGTYLIRISSDKGSVVKKLIIVK